VVSGFAALFAGFSKWSNSRRKSTVLEAIVCIIRVVVRETDECVGENRGYGALFVVGTRTS
jgi:hypothetical protein